MTSPLRIGILGTGGISKRALADPAASVPEVTVRLIGSRNVEQGKAFAASVGAAGACSYEELIAHPDVDIVYVALPPALHAAWSIRALQAGKHVLCEKPMTSNEAEALQVAAVAKASGRVYMEAFHYPYHPFAKRVRDLLDTHVIGPITGATAEFEIPRKVFKDDNNRFNYALGGGAMMDAGCYALHALRLLLGTPEGVTEARADLGAEDPRIDMGMSATLAFAGGRTGKLRASFLAGDAPGSSVVVHGERGRLETRLLYVPQWGGELALHWEGRTYTEKADPTPTYVFQLRELVRCIRDGAPVLTSAEDGVINMRMIDAIYRKAGLPTRGLA